MRRIAILGNAGSGKTTLALGLGRRLGLPVVHLDREYWRPGWIPTPAPEWRRTHARLADGEEWILDGNYFGTLAERLLRADTAIFLDVPAPLCLLAVTLRSLRHLGQARPDLTAGCPERLPDRDFVDFIWRYSRVQRVGVRRLLAEFARRGGRVLVLRSRRQARALAAALAGDTAGRRA